VFACSWASWCAFGPEDRRVVRFWRGCGVLDGNSRHLRRRGDEKMI